VPAQVRDAPAQDRIREQPDSTDLDEDGGVAQPGDPLGRV
jgi:hypothetical protein